MMDSATDVSPEASLSLASTMNCRSLCSYASAFSNSSTSSSTSLFVVCGLEPDGMVHLLSFARRARRAGSSMGQAATHLQYSNRTEPLARQPRLAMGCDQAL